jgi:hypothetical protein
MDRSFTNSFSDTVTGSKMLNVGFVGTVTIESVQNRGTLFEFLAEDDGVSFHPSLSILALVPSKLPVCWLYGNLSCKHKADDLVRLRVELHLEPSIIIVCLCNMHNNHIAFRICG